MTSNEKDLKIFMNYRRLKDIKRCNNFPVINQEDVAQHSFYVAFLAMVIADEYNTWASDNNIGYSNPFDTEHQYVTAKTEIVIRKALTHDLEESFTSDIPWNIKHMDEQVHETITKAINQRIDKAYENSSTMELYHDIGSKCKDGFEGRFVDIADMLELGIYCWEERAKGNHFLQPMIDKCMRLIQSYAEYETLIKASPLFKSLMGLLGSLPSIAETLIDID